MRKTSISQAMNKMQRAIDDIVYPPPIQEEQRAIWSYFNSRCAYCEKRIDPHSRYGHIDHLNSHAGSRRNWLGNCVLACKECNGNEKRDKPWKTHLKTVCKSKGVFKRRLKKIQDWIDEQEKPKQIRLNQKARDHKRKAEALIGTFGDTCRKLRNVV